MSDSLDVVKLKRRLLKVEGAVIQSAAALLQISSALTNMRHQRPEMEELLGAPADELNKRIQNMLEKLEEATNADE